MTAQERLATALSVDAGNDQTDEGRDGRYEWWERPSGLAARILAADPTLAQDIADGQALRLLRDALPFHAGIRMYWWKPKGVPTAVVQCEWSELPAGRKRRVYHRSTGQGTTIAEAADAARAALEARRG